MRLASLMGYAIGITVIVIAIQRYAIGYPDLDRLLLYVLVGINTIGIFYNFNRGSGTEKRVEHIDDVMQEIIG